jgi:hypothetical protein
LSEHVTRFLGLTPTGWSYVGFTMTVLLSGIAGLGAFVLAMVVLI